MVDSIGMMGGSSSPMMGGIGSSGGNADPVQKYQEALQKYLSAPEDKKDVALAMLMIAIQKLEESQKGQSGMMSMLGGGNNAFSGINLNQGNSMGSQPGGFSMMM
jgi:hypothetical protein